MRSVGVSAAVALLFVLSVLGLNAALATSPEEPASDVGGCVIRLYDTGPQVHVDSTHTCPFVTDVHVRDDGALIVDRRRAGSIQAVVVSPDETLTARGILAGASWARSTTTIRFYDTTTGTVLRADDPRLHGATSNVWIAWMS